MTLFFVHIPKTAGTSFRNGLVSYFGADRVVCDHGINSSLTSDVTKRFIYTENPDAWEFQNACNTSNIALVSGHVKARKFAPAFGTGHTITFLRHPTQRLASEYAHLVRKGTCKSDFQSFYRRQNMRNRQSKILQDIPLEAIGFIGITERYRESMQLLNAVLNTAIPVREANRAGIDTALQSALESADSDEIVALNEDDFLLYELGLRLLQTRVQLSREGKTYTHARIHTVEPHEIIGWAWFAGNFQEPVTIEIVINGSRVGTTVANELRPELCFLQPPRLGYVGFSYRLDAKAGDHVQCRVLETGQCFPAEPYLIRDSHTPCTGDMNHVAADTRLVRGYVDLVNCRQCAGWAYDKRHPHQVATVELYLDEQYIGRATASHSRPDVLEAGLHPTGQCGFWFEWPDGVHPSQDSHIAVRVEGDIEPLDGVYSLQH